MSIGTIIEQLTVAEDVVICKRRDIRTPEDFDEYFTVETPDKTETFPPESVWMMLMYARQMVEWAIK